MEDLGVRLSGVTPTPGAARARTISGMHAPAPPPVVIIVFTGNRNVGWLLPTGAPAQPFAGTLELFARLSELTAHLPSDT
jgi:hypothetical protein